MHLDFETGTFEGWSVKRLAAGHSAVIQSEVVRTGTRACRFELRPGDYVSQGHRAELRDPMNAPLEEAVWYGFSTFIAPQHCVSQGVGLVLAQWHDQAKLGDPSGKPPIAIRYRDGRLRVTGAHGKFASPNPDECYEFAGVDNFRLGVWHDFVFRVFWSRHGASEIRAWLNGEPFIDWRGPLGYENEAEGPYFKLGVYCSPPDARPVVAYHDNYSRGHSYAEVDPAVLHAPAVALPRLARETPDDAAPSPQRCALAVLPAEGGDAGRLIASVHEAAAFGLGDLGEIAPVSCGAGGDARAVLAEAAEAAAEGGFDWLLAASAAETLSPDIFVKIAPALRLHDAVWGGAGLVVGDTVTKLDRITRLAAQDLPTLFHAALQWWIGPAHFVRPRAALRALQTTAGEGWYADYMLALWRDAGAYKTAQRLTDFHGALPPLSGPDRARLISALEQEPVFMAVRHGDQEIRLPYTGVNPVIEREQARGLFFEAEELRFLAERLPRGLRIVDVGANTGNHTLFFATVMDAERVVPIEPHPRAVAAIRAAVAENRLGNVDLSRLGQAVGAARGRLRTVLSSGGGLGATRYVPDLEGGITLSPLDAVVEGRVDLIKIDVEGMEMDVLAGAAGLFARRRPYLFVEVLDDKVAEFLAWTDAVSYRIEKLFPDKTHCNYFAVPAEEPRGKAFE